MGRYWVQADCVLIEADDPVEAIAEYRRLLAQFEVACSNGRYCDAMLRLKGNPARYDEQMAKQVRGARDNFTKSMDT